MKILIINSRFFLSGGPEKYMFELMDLLKAKGHKIISFSTKHSDNHVSEYQDYFAEPIDSKDKVYFKDYKKDIRTFFQVAERLFYSNHVKKKLRKLIQDTKPDIAYILHHYNKLSPSIIDACKEFNLPVVMRISDFFLLCPEGHLYTNNDVCKRCINHSLMNAVRYKCIKDSYSASFVKMMALSYHRFIKIYDKVDYFVCPSQFTTNMMGLYFDKSRICHIPTFVELSKNLDKAQKDYVLLVSRLEPHKGILTAIKAFAGSDIKLKIVGKSSTGYGEVLESFIKENDVENVEMAGPKYGEELRKIYNESRFVIIPAEWYENMPNVALEAMIAGKPVVASNIGSLKEIIIDNYNGLLFEPKNAEELKEKVKSLYDDKDRIKRLGQNAYRDACDKFNPERHYKSLMKLFKKAIGENEAK